TAGLRPPDGARGAVRILSQFYGLGRLRSARELRGDKISFDGLRFLRRSSEQMYVDLVGAESGSVMADLGKIEHSALVEEPANRKHGPRRTVGATHQNVVRVLNRRAIEQAVDGM